MERAPLALGFGFSVAATLMVPIVNFALLPLAVIGGAMLVAENPPQKSEAGTLQQSTTSQDNNLETNPMRVAIFTLGVLLIVGQFAQADEVYRWTDNEGKTHYTRPARKHSTRISEKTGIYRHKAETTDIERRLW